MKYVELMSLNSEEVKKYHKKKTFLKIFKKYESQPITNDIINELLKPLFKSILFRVPPETAEWLKLNFLNFVPEAIEHVRRNAHMNDARGEAILTQEWADALLIGVANNACPHSSLETRDLYAKK